MSNWTHVIGSVRLDSIRLSDTIPDFDEIFGKECLWESPDEVWDEYEENPKTFMPMGSEGSLQKSVWVNPKKSSLAAYTITIFGDLRDHHSASKIIDWFRDKCENSPFPVRDAVIVARNEITGTEEWHK